MKYFILTIALILSVSYSYSQGVGISDAAITPSTMLDVEGDVAFRQGSDLNLVNGGNNNVSIGDYSFYRITGPTAMFSLTGLNGGVDGKIAVLYNVSNQPMIVVNNSGL